MALTRQRISEMNEAQLRKEVLIPLFRAIKFRSVIHHHGGTLELGKDITMWKEDDLGERVNYGVVVKAKKVSGQPTGKGSANEVLFQPNRAVGAKDMNLCREAHWPRHALDFMNRASIDLTS